MRVGYVSDERYVALVDVALEFINEQGESWEARSRATGAVFVDAPPGRYTVTLQRAGYGSKRSQVILPTTEPYHFRLLSDCLLGYAWPKWVRTGELSEFRVHAVEQYQLELWRYGWTPEFVRNLGWFDEHGPRATMQVTPDGDYTQTGVEWNKVGYNSPTHKQFIAAPDRSGLYYFRARTHSGLRFSFPWIVAPKRPTASLAVLASNMTWNAYNSFGGRSNYIHADLFPPTPTVNSRTDLIRYSNPDFVTWNYPDYAPLSFDRPEPFNDIDFDERITDPIQGASSLSPRTGGMAITRLARATRTRIRLLRGIAIGRRNTRPIRVQGIAYGRASRILDETNVRSREEMGLRTGRTPALSGWQWSELRSGDFWSPR